MNIPLLTMRIVFQRTNEKKRNEKKKETIEERKTRKKEKINWKRKGKKKRRKQEKEHLRTSDHDYFQFSYINLTRLVSKLSFQ